MRRLIPVILVVLLSVSALGLLMRARGGGVNTPSHVLGDRLGRCFVEERLVTPIQTRWDSAQHVFSATQAEFDSLVDAFNATVEKFTRDDTRSGVTEVILNDRSEPVQMIRPYLQPNIGELNRDKFIQSCDEYFLVRIAFEERESVEVYYFPVSEETGIVVTKSF